MRSTCSWLNSDGTLSGQLAVAKEPNAYSTPTSATGDYNSWATYSFGAYHPGVFNALLGDGSVSSVNNIVSVPKVLNRLIWVNDGEMVDFP